MELGGSQTRGDTDQIVVRKFVMRGLCIPVGFELVVDHCQHLGYRVVYTFHPTVAVWVVGAGGGDFSNPEKVIYGAQNLGAEELEAVVRENAARAPPDRNRLVQH